MKVKIDARPCGLIELYETAAKEYINQLYDGCIKAVDFSEYEFDCRKINVSEHIQNMFYEYYTELAKEQNDKLYDSEIKTGITILLAMSGPKVDYNLVDNEVEIFDGFIC